MSIFSNSSDNGHKTHDLVIPNLQKDCDFTTHLSSAADPSFVPILNVERTDMSAKPPYSGKLDKHTYIQMHYFIFTNCDGVHVAYTSL